MVAFSFLAEVTGGELGISDETTEANYFSVAEMEQMDVMEAHLERIEDALAQPEGAIFK